MWLLLLGVFASKISWAISFVELPDEIKKDIPLLMVDRKSSLPDSYMITEQITGVASPKKVYRITPTGLLEIKTHAVSQILPADSSGVPSHISISGRWIDADNADDRSANILGGFGVFRIESDTLAIPVAPTRKDTLAYYGARLLEFGDEISFETNRDLPICTMSIGENYKENYLLKENLGGGFYLEYHDMPHFHMPLNSEARGYLVLGKKATDGNFHLSAFSIPFGKAIYTPGNVIHDDALLIGRYQVIYSVTENFSTVAVKDPEGKPVKIEIKN